MCGNEVTNKSPNKEDSILHVDIKIADKKIWFVNEKE
jgi:hypothetical protein